MHGSRRRRLTQTPREWGRVARSFDGDDGMGAADGPGAGVEASERNLMLMKSRYATTTLSACLQVTVRYLPSLLPTLLLEQNS